MPSIASVHHFSYSPSLRRRCLGPRFPCPSSVIVAAVAAAKISGPRVGIKEDATQLVGSTPMVRSLDSALFSEREYSILVQVCSG